MKRIAAIILLMMTATSALAQERLEVPTLKSDVTVASNLVRIGDLVENAGPAASVAIFRAPDLGETGSVPVERIVEALRPHNVIGLKTRGLSEVRVTRAGRAITLTDIERRIAQTFANQSGLGEARNLTVTLDRDARAIHVEATATAELQVARASVEPRSGRFEIAFDLPGSRTVSRAGLRYAGTIAEMIETATPVRAIARGEILRSADIVVQRRPKAEVGENAVSAEQAIGLAARQTLRPGQFLRSVDLGRPEIVTRNDTVTIFYEAPGIMLTLRGKANESGAEGDMINVLNIQSKRILQAVVTGPGRVAVTGTIARVASNDRATGAARPQ
ncbi:MAG: flagellar basal body P-ring formation chaperone FlgA [Pseudorhodoplanes sp.]